MNTTSILIRPAGALLLLCASFASFSCNDSGSGGNKKPRVVSTVPTDLATDVPRNSRVSATFNQPMDPATLNAATFLLTSGPAQTPVTGTVIYDTNTATFWPSALLDAAGSYDASITTGASNLAGVPLRELFTWHFDTGATVEPGRAVPLGTASQYAILAKSGISTVPTSDITGDLGVSPAAAASITGFALTPHASNTYSTSTQVTGKVYAADYAAPTPGNLTTAVLDMERAFTDAAARAPGTTELGAGSIGGLTLAPGVYRWSTGLLIPTDVTLNGSATDVWILQVAQGLTLSNATSVILTGGALPENVFWQVAGAVNLGTTSQLSGIVLCATAINLQTGATVNGRLLAQTAVTLDSSTVTVP